MTTRRPPLRDQFLYRRITRRRALRATGTAAALAGAALVVGCGDDGGDGDGTPAAGSPQASPRSGGTYSLASPTDFDTFDPHLSVAGALTYMPRLYNAVINRSPRTNSFEFNDLAQSLEQPDDTTYVFSIRPGVKVAPNDLGVPERDLDAHDVKATFDRIVTLPQSNAYGFVGQWIASTEASADGKTVTIKTKEPYGYFFVRIGSIVNLIIPRELVDRGSDMQRASAGGGPYVLRRGAYAEGQGARLTRNPSYYRRDENNGNAPLPYIDEIDVKIITDRAALRTAFASGQSDQYTAQDSNEARSLESGNNYTVVRDPTNTFIAFTMNPTRDPWKDDRIRRAAMHAIDRQAYIDRVYNGEAQPNGLVHWSLGDYALPADELEQLQGYDPARSRELIRAATGQDRISVKVMWPAESTIEEHNLHLPIWLEQMREAGFDVQQDPQAFATWLDSYTNLSYDASLALNQVYEWAEVNMDFQHSEGPARNNIYAAGVGKLYPEIDAAVDEAKGITDPERQASATRDLQRLIYEKGPAFLPLVTPYSFTLYQPRVKNIPQDLGSSATFVNTWYLES